MDFQAAASSGDANTVRALLQDGIVVTQNWHMTRPPLCLAAGNGHIEVVQLLINEGKFDPGDVDERDRTALSWAAGRGHKKVVKYLLAREDANKHAADEEGWTALSWAAANGFATVARILMEGGADVNSKDKCGRTPLSWASSNGHKDVVKMLLAQDRLDVQGDVDNKKRTPFLRAAAKGKREHVEIMKKILAKDKTCLAHADENKRTPLSWAAGAGHVKATELLLKRKAEIRTVDDSGRTPLSWAAEHGHEKVVAMLLDGDKRSQHSRSASNNDSNTEPDPGPIANIKDKTNQAPILYAAKNGHDKVVKLLIYSRTPSTDDADNDGRTPLSWAASKGHDNVVGPLLQLNRFSGVDVNKKDNEHETALSWAAKEGHRRVVWMLSGHPKIEPNHARTLDKRTALSLAADRGLHTIVKELLSTKNIDKDAKDAKNKTALMLAYEGKHKKTMKVLIDGGVDLEVRLSENMTILMLAAKEGNNTSVQLLIDHGADIFAENAKDKDRTAMRYAILNEHESVENQLRAAMEKQKQATAKAPAAQVEQIQFQTA
ncbi:hypothetical protein SNOG_12834 [Parastagonospora nodorum SN15]|uniref:Uncharacterized protein n=1 Tax=Phaeosphaeria nodorum (strain SN15 / ATCC MYA-4574 / FGSC 10173) TaxID=321614 RepID=Q0U5Y0_PHANO|nr:hypothetical protein SNOG_12834 [Parastagonospora nodorum SN15]EAT79634.2 hypothetical protein SNOG_12834 [Parastagonospora nodorum SN15]